MPGPTDTTNLDLGKPFFLILNERGADGGEGKYFWSPGMSVGMESPPGYDRQPESYVTRIEVNSSFSPPVNTAEITFGNTPGSSPKIGTNDNIVVFLGYYSRKEPGRPDYTRVFTGCVSSIERGLSSCTATIVSRMKILCTVRRNMVINRDTIDRVIERLAQEAAGIDIAEISPSDIQKTRYVFSKSRTLYENMRELCIEGGMELYTDVHDRLVAKVWEPEEVSPGTSGPEEIYSGTRDKPGSKQYIHNFYLGLDIMNIELSEGRDRFSSIDIWGFSDYGEESETLYSIERSSVKMGSEDDERDPQRGSGKSMYLPFVPRSSAEKIARNLMEHYSEPLGGPLTVTGAPHVRLNDGVRLAGRFFGREPFPGVVGPVSEWDAIGAGDEVREDDGGGKTFHVIGLSHVFDTGKGFFTVLRIRGREPPEVGVPDDKETGGTDQDRVEEEKDDPDIAKEDMSGESVIAPEYPLVADMEAEAILRARDRFKNRIKRLRDTSGMD